MSGRRALLLAGLGAAALGLILNAAAPGAAQARTRRGPTVEQRAIVIEGGAALPQGDLGRDLFARETSFGAEGGYSIGARFRATWPSGWALSPSFHFEDFGDFTGSTTDGVPVAVKTSIVRYGLDAQYFWPGATGGVQPFLSAGLALCHNRYRDEQLGAKPDYYEASVNALAFAFGAGVRVAEFEIAATYNVNRFASARLLTYGALTDYDWDYVAVRVGIALPTED